MTGIRSHTVSVTIRPIREQARIEIECNHSPEWMRAHNQARTADETESLVREMLKARGFEGKPFTRDLFERFGVHCVRLARDREALAGCKFDVFACDFPE